MTASVIDILPPQSRRGGGAVNRVAAAIETGRQRLVIAGALFAIAFGGVALRLVDVMAFGQGGEPSLVHGALAADGSAAGERAEILDRNGVILATTLPSASLFADPKLVIDPVEAAVRLSAMLPDLDYEKLLVDLSSDRRFVWLKRGLTPRQQYEINRLGIPGLAFQEEERRYYPAGNLTAHAVGYTNIDNRGIAGLEQALDAVLERGESVRLALDLRVQELVRNELQASIDEFSAIGGAAIVMDANTGEVLAMVSLPDFNPYEPVGVPDETLFNRSTLGVYEMGSTFKIFNTAMALDTGTSTMASMYDAAHPIRIGRFTITDFHPEGRALTLPEIFMHSSNIGSVHMAQAAGIERQREFLGRIGLTRPSPIELPEVGAPMIPNPWREINLMTIAFGHGMAVSPMQMVAAVGAVVNGGTLLPPTLIRRDPGAAIEGVRVMSEETSDNMRRLLRLVVTDGTASLADAPGYLVGGKTGTADKVQGRGYRENARLSSFIGAFPMTDPRYVVFAMLDDPQATAKTYGYATGGWTAAPLVGRIIEQFGPMVGVRPLDVEAPEILEAMAIGPGRPEGRLTLAADH